MTDDECVADVLGSTWSGDETPLYHHLVGDVPERVLDYDDWIEPMAVTAGRICLRLTAPDRTHWIRWDTSGVFRHRTEPSRADGRGERRIAEPRLRHWVDQYPVDPVLIEDSPFGTRPTDGHERTRGASP